MKNGWWLIWVAIILSSLAGAALRPGAVSNEPFARKASIADLLKRSHGPLNSERVANLKLTRGNAMRTIRMEAQTVPAPPPSRFGFLAAAQLSAGGGAYSSAVTGDFNGDHKQDLAVAVFTDYGSQAAFYLAVLLGNGDGSFQPAILTPVSASFADAILVADLNGDGRDDVVYIHYGYLEVFLSLGNGQFSNPVAYADGADNPAAALLFDVNHDGRLDIVVADQIRSTVSTLLVNGNGTFQPFTLEPAPSPLRNAVLGDVNGDGRLDIVTDSQVFLALASGGFAPATPLVTPEPALGTCDGVQGAVTVADLNGDNHPDVVVADCWRNSVNVFLNNGDGTFAPGTYEWTGIFPQATTVSDINNDGKPDLVVTNAYSSDMSVALGKGDGTFDAPGMGNASGGFVADKPAVADFDGDGNKDVVLAVWVSDLEFGLTYFRGYGDGNFAAAKTFHSPQLSTAAFSYGFSVATADLNGDGRPDVILGNAGSSETGVTVFLANPDGTLQAGANYGSGGNLTSVTLADFTGDGKIDVAALDAVSGQVELFIGNGDGTLQPPQPLSGTSPAESMPSTLGIVSGNFSGHGKTDIAFLRSNPASVAVLAQDENGGFSESASYTLGNPGAAIVTGDLNGDGLLDLVVPHTDSDSVSILLGRGDGTFQPVPDLTLGHTMPAGAAIADVNNDGEADLIVAVDDWKNGEGIAVALGNGDGSFAAPTFFPATTHIVPPLQPDPREVRVLDLDRDGRSDLIFTNSGYGTIGVLFGRGDGSFYDPVEFAVGGYPFGLALADLNGDGAVDAVVGNNEFSGVTVMLNTSGTSTLLVSSENPSAYGTPLSLTATVTATVPGVNAVPGGSITFWDGNNVLSTLPLSGGRAALVVPTLTAGTHQISATYSGDLSFLPSASAALPQQVLQLIPPDYRLTASPASATIHRGESTVFWITATPEGGFSGTVNFACGPMPVGVSCQFSPSSVMLDGTTPQTVQLTVSAAAQMMASTHRGAPLKGKLGLSFTLAASVLGCVMLEGLGQRKRRLLKAMAAVVILVALITLVGCGSGNTPNPVPPPHTLNLKVTALAAASGAGNSDVSHGLTVTVTIEQR